MGDAYDFMIVGAGPAGCLLACRLATAFKSDRILLIEAGGDNKATEYQGFGDRNFTLATAPGFNWGYKTVPQEHLGQREVDYSRGKGLGGSTAINFCVWTRGPSSDYNRWAEIVGDDTWCWPNVEERYKKIEKIPQPSEDSQRYVDFGDKVACAHGEVEVSLPKKWDAEFGSFLDNTQHDGYPRALDINSGNPIGLGVVQSSAANGSRVTAATAHLSGAPKNLTVLTGQVVVKVIGDGSKIQGVVMESGTMFLSAGALDTPKILLLSGIGSKSKLEELEIPCIRDLPGIGKNLYDRLFMELVTVHKPGTPHRTSYLPSSLGTLDEARKQWAQDETGPFSEFFLPQMIGYLKSKALVESEEFKALTPEVQAALQAKTSPHFELISHSLSASVASPEQYLYAIAGFMSLQSSGTVTLRSKDSSDPPLVDPKFLDEAFDRRIAIEAVRETFKFLNSPSLTKDHVRFAAEPESLSDEDIWAFVSKAANSMWHTCGTVAMGKPHSPDPCVNTDFRVIGLKGLRVVDMSVAPFLSRPRERATLLNPAKISSDVTYIRRDVAGNAADPNASATAPPSYVSTVFAAMPPRSILGKPLGNAAFWQEALDFDAQRNSGKANQNVYQQLAFLQLNENAAVSFTSFAEPDALQMSSLISRALQYAQIYPAQLTQPQAAYPAETL
ncbi:MAG: hypothetical protein L6R37_008034, partial [Teloschistes peruensis]